MIVHTDRPCLAGGRIYEDCVTLLLQFAEGVQKGSKIALRDAFFNLLGVLTITDKYTPDKVGDGCVGEPCGKLAQLCSCM